MDYTVMFVPKYVIFEGKYYLLVDKSYKPSYEEYEEYYQEDKHGIPVKVIVLPEIKEPPRRLIL